MTPPSSRRVSQTFTADDFAQALDQQQYGFEKGQVVRGKVFEHNSRGAFVDVGGKSPAFVPLEEASLKKVEDIAQALPLQEEQEFLVIREQDAEGQITLSRRRLELKQVWEQLAHDKVHNQSVTVRVNGLNKGGVTVNVRGLRGFIPRSHLVDRDNMEALVGQRITAGYLEVDPEHNKLILSQRLVAQTTSLDHLEVGQLISGSVAAIKPFGLFVKFGDSTGLLHIKQISQSFIQSLPDLFQIGQPIKAMITELDESKGRISLSTRVLENHGGEMLENREAVMADAEERVDKARTKLLKGSTP